MAWRLLGVMLQSQSGGFTRQLQKGDKIMNKIKKAMFAFLAILGISVPAFAQEVSTGNPIEAIGAKVAQEMATWTSSLTDFFVDNSTTIFSILGVAVAVMLIWMVFKFFRKGTSKVG